MTPNTRVVQERKPRCRCYINASYGNAFARGTSGVRNFKPCPVHDVEEIHHKDGDPGNNALDNLEVRTRRA